MDSKSRDGGRSQSKSSTASTIGGFASINAESLVTAIRIRSDFKYLHHFVPKVVDHFHCDPAILRFIERPRGVAVEGGPGLFINLGFECDLERLVGIICTEK